MRAILVVGPDGVRIFSRNRREVTSSFPELGSGFGDRTMILDASPTRKPNDSTAARCSVE